MSQSARLKRKAEGEGGSDTKKYKTKYHKEWEKQYPWARGCSSHVQDHLFKYHCNFCNVDNSCGYGGVNDLKVHEGIGNQCNVLLLRKSY